MNNDLFTHSLWSLGVRGVVAILFGVLAFLWPGLSLLVLRVLFIIYALVTGIDYVIGALAYQKTESDWWLPLSIGLVNIGAGLIALLTPDMTALVLLLLMGANAVATGVLDIASAISLRHRIGHEWQMTLSGAIAIVFSILAFLFPATGAVALVWLVSLYAVLSGIFLLSLSFQRQKLLPHGGGGVVAH
jgi:uncharacterized membrane protein HdeD (DUF308 family)